MPKSQLGVCRSVSGEGYWKALLGIPPRTPVRTASGHMPDRACTCTSAHPLASKALRPLANNATPKTGQRREFHQAGDGEARPWPLPQHEPIPHGSPKSGTYHIAEKTPFSEETADTPWQCLCRTPSLTLRSSAFDTSDTQRSAATMNRHMPDGRSGCRGNA